MPVELEHLLPDGSITRLSSEDADLLAHRWWLDTNGYVAGRPNGTFTYLHRVVLERALCRQLDAGEVTDHINGIRSDNRRSNLRPANASQSMMNRAKQEGTSSRYIGVSYVTNEQKRIKRWKAYIRVNGRQITVGYFHGQKDAARARDAAAIQHYGAYARLNNV